METYDWSFPWRDRVIWSAYNHYIKLLKRLLGSQPEITPEIIFKNKYDGDSAAIKFANKCWLELVGMFDLMPTNHYVINAFRDAILSATVLLMMTERTVDMEKNDEDQLLISTSFEIISKLDKYDRFLASEFGLDIY